jgi:hypothetical protein
MFLYVIALRTSIQRQKRISVYLEFWSLHTVFLYVEPSLFLKVLEKILSKHFDYG